MVFLYLTKPDFSTEPNRSKRKLMQAGGVDTKMTSNIKTFVQICGGKEIECLLHQIPKKKF